MYSQPVADPDDDPSLYTEFPLIISKKALMEGKRFHAMRLQSDKEVNPFDESQFTRPLRLHRRFPRDTMNMPDPNADTTADDKEREKDAIRRAEREAEKEANRAQIAPTDKSAARKKQQFKKKTEDVYYPTDTPEAQKRQRLRYEEGRPWHLEDFDGKNTWVGSYEEPLSETNAMLKIEGAGFTVVPLEKWYKFTPTGRYKTMDLDEAEARMEKKMKDSRWFMGGADDAQRRREEIERQARLQRGRVGMRGEGRAKREDDDEERMDIANDVDEIDFEFDDEFQDDDEGKLFGGDDEDVKDAERRIREEQRAANIFAGTGVKEEKDWDEEEEKEKKKEQEERRKARKLRKNLIANERKFEYDSDSDHPYSEVSTFLHYMLRFFSQHKTDRDFRATRRTRKLSVNGKKSARKPKRKPRWTKPTASPRAPLPMGQTHHLAVQRNVPILCETSSPPAPSSDLAHRTCLKLVAPKVHTSVSRRSTRTVSPHVRCPQPLMAPPHVRPIMKPFHTVFTY